MRCEKNLDLLDTNNLKKGTCYVHIEGYLNKSFYGEAIYENVSTGFGYTLFFLELKDITKPGVNYRYVEFQGGSKPNVGTYTLYNFENDSLKGTLLGRYNDSEVLGNFQSLGGTIEIEYSNVNELKGWADFYAYESVSIGNGQFIRVEIRITAKFYAEEGYTGIILN